MNKVKAYTIGLFVLGLFLFTSCNNTPTETETTPGAVEGSDPTRYNINAPDEEVINLDSTTVDSSATTK